MTLSTTRFTQALLDLEEDEPDVLFETLPWATVPLWPQVRMNLAYALSETELASITVAAASSRRRDLYRATRSFIPSRWDATSFDKRREIAFVTGGVTTAFTAAGERNWLISDFAEAFPNESIILQWRAIRPWRTRPAFPMTRTLDPLNARAEVRTRLRSPARDPDLIRRLVVEYARLLGGGIRDDQIEAITASAVYDARVSVVFDREFDAILDRLRPKLMLIDSPVDGGRGAVIAGMKSRGIHVAEPQHGWIGPSHGAYNFGAAMRRPELAVALPDELLTFGRYWSRGLRHVGTVTSIGKPHLEKMARSVSAIEERPREVLVVSSVGEPEQAAQFVLALAEALPDGWSVRFRPHPSERLVVTERYPRLASSAAVTLDERVDVYESLAATRIVVGVASTVLFEAVAMGCRVFVRDTPYVPFIVGDLFGTPIRGGEGLARIAKAAAGQDSSDHGFGVDADDLWEPNAVANFRAWVDRRGAAATR